MCDHTESVYKNNCVKVVKSKTPETIACLEKQVQKLRLSSAASSINASTEKNQMKSLLEFYDSIPEYDDVNHLSNKEFYKKLDYLRQRQRTFYESLMSDTKSEETWYDNYKNLNNNRNSIIKVKSNDVINHKPPSRRSVRIESPEITDDKLSKNERRPKSCRVYSGSSVESTLRCKTKGQINKSPYFDSTLDDLSDCTLTTRSVPCSPRKQISSNTPDTFKMTVRDEEDNVIHSDEVVIKKHNFANANEGMFRANPVPIESRIPLFDKIMQEQEIRRSNVKQKSKNALKAQMNLFSFTKREEEISELTRRLSKSTPDLFLSIEKPRKPKQFKAKPVPKNLFSNYVYQKMHEDEYYRSLQKKIRAEEMLKTASLPPSMAKREKSKPKYQICPKSFREMYENQMRKIPPARRKDLEKELAELELDYIMATPSPVNKPKTTKKRKANRKSSSSSSGKSSRSSATLESINRSNLAAVLRIQTSRLFDRKRMEDEICRRLEEAQQKEEARWREKVLRKRPVWQSLAYSHEEDLNMRLQVRRDEERMRNEAHRAQMEVMLGRVNQQPTLFERQSAGKFATREDLITIAELYDETYPKMNKQLGEQITRNGSGDSRRKCVEMKDEGIQAKLDDVLSEKDDCIENDK